MTKKDFLEGLEILGKKTNAEWLSELEDRKLQELEFHNQNRDQNIVSNLPSDTYEKLHGNKKFYRTVKLSTDYVDTWIKQNSPGKIFLDYACGNGVNAIKAARAGADLSVGLDISNVSIRNACLSAEENGVSGITYFIQGDCENTGLPVECVDVIICSGMLHHLDLNYAFPELKRILKPGGVILAVEALDYNPFIKLYRNLTPQMRTEWEKSHILSYKDIAFASKFFKIKEIRHWHLFSILGVFVPFALPLLNSIDSFVLRIPLIKIMSWMFTFELHKK